MLFSLPGAAFGRACETPRLSRWCEASPSVSRLSHHGLRRLQRLPAGRPPGDKGRRLHGRGHSCSAQAADRPFPAQVEPPGARLSAFWQAAVLRSGVWRMLLNGARSLSQSVILWTRIRVKGFSQLPIGHMLCLKQIGSKLKCLLPRREENVKLAFGITVFMRNG